MSKKSDVLESWIMVEHLSEGDINLNDKSIITLSNLGDENYYDLFIREIQKKINFRLPYILIRNSKFIQK